MGHTVGFYKYQGTGNDFIIIDNRDFSFFAEMETIIRLCDRHYGIGADGLMLLEKSKSSDFHMRYFNCDGNEATMCGNGGRCIAAFARRTGISGEKVSFTGADGKHFAIVEENGTVHLEMNDVKGASAEGDAWIINTGSPHYVEFRNKIEKIDLAAEGRKIRFSHRFKPDGINVNFAERKGNELFIRTYERGVEDETLSCGTGSVAAAIASYLKTGGNTTVNINTRGGKLTVEFKAAGKDNFTGIKLSGPAVFVFSGRIET